MKMKFGEIEIGIEEKFFYDPHETITNICTMCSRKNCPVDCKDIVTNCNSYEYTGAQQNSTEWRVIQGIVVSNDNFGYVVNCTS